VDLRRHKQDWEDLAELDPLWSILGARERRGGRWDHEAFFATGEQEIDDVLRTAERHELRAFRRDHALDFGCGVGRVTRALATRFRNCVGVDISEKMVRLARELNADRANCEFVVNVERDLRGFDDERFDLVYSSLVLQHLPSRELARRYVAEFLRVARADGLVVFQIPARIGWMYRLQPKRRLYSLLRGLGIDERVLFHRGHLDPTRMIALKPEDVHETVERHGGRVVLAEAPVSGGDRYYVAARA
jgi:SAM-dependent methyltransferase